MKKLILIIAIVFSGMLMHAQIKGIDLKKAIAVKQTTPPDSVYNMLVVYDSMYIILYKSNTVGVVHSHRRLLSILKANELDFDDPTYDNSYLESDIKGYDDYENIPYSVRGGRSVIIKGWEINEYELAWILDEDKYAIYIQTIKE